MKKDQRVRNIMANPAENNVKNESPVQENKMGVMPVGKLLFSMSLPIMISMLVQALYNVVDSMFVARVSENALTALSMVFPIQNLMIAVSAGLGVGLNAVLSRALGAKDEKVFAQLDLTSENIIHSPFFYLQQNDVVYVEPNKARIVGGNAGAFLPYVLSSISTLVAILAIAIR